MTYSYHLVIIISWASVYNLTGLEEGILLDVHPCPFS